jgi:hypothetical protein
VRLKEVVWLESVIEKLLVTHGVSREEVREVLDNRTKIMFAEKGNRENEDVYLALDEQSQGDTSPSSSS